MARIVFWIKKDAMFYTLPVYYQQGLSSCQTQLTPNVVPSNLFFHIN